MRCIAKASCRSNHLEKARNLEVAEFERFVCYAKTVPTLGPELLSLIT